MRVRVTRENFRMPGLGGSWYNKYIGESFEVIEKLDMVPVCYAVDIASLFDRGLEPSKRAYIAVSDCEVVEED